MEETGYTESITVVRDTTMTKNLRRYYSGPLAEQVEYACAHYVRPKP